jgi:hypothetical protein
VKETALATPHEVSAKQVAASPRALWVVVCTAWLVYLVGLVYYANVRPLDGDEGYYITAARLVWEGKTPYRDFAYPQGIMLPYLYSWIWAVHPRSLVSMRLLSVACGAIAVLLWGVWLIFARRFSTAVVLASFAVILLNPYWVWWNVALKTFAVANLLVSVAMVCLYVALRSRQVRWYVTAGVSLGACASVRSLYAPLVAFVFIWLAQMEWQTPGRRFKGSLSFLGGVACGVLPMVLSFGSDPQAFIFNNMKYRTLLSPHESLRHTVHVYLNNLLSLFHHTYFIATVLLAFAGMLSVVQRRDKRESLYDHQDYLFFQLAILMLVVYVATASIPFPVFDQYFTSPLLPFLVVFIAEGLRVALRFKAASVFLLAMIIPLLFFHGLKGEAEEYASNPYLRLPSFYKVAEVLKANTHEDDVVLSIWPGYVFESGRRYFPGSENQFNYDISAKVNPEARARYHLLSKQGVIDAISSRAVSIYISSPSKYYLDAFMSAEEILVMRRALNTSYILAGKIDEVEVYRRR